MPDDAIEAAIQKLREQRAYIDQAIVALEAVRSGVVVQTATASGASPTAPTRGSVVVGEVAVNRGEFYGLSLTKAAEKILRRSNRPMKTDEILSALRRAEFKMSDKYASANLYTGMNRSKDFIKVLPNTWALAEWHPDVAITETKPARRTSRRKTRRSKAAVKSSQHAQTDQPAIKAVS